MPTSPFRMHWNDAGLECARVFHNHRGREWRRIAVGAKANGNSRNPSSINLGAVLASVCSGELTVIQSLIENDGTDEWVRGAALSSLVMLVAAGQKSRDEIVSYFARLFRGKLVRQWSHMWDALVSYSSELYPAELLEDIERAYKQGLVDPG